MEELRRVLVVEDDDSIARFLHQALSEAGYHTQVVSHGDAALGALRNRTFDALVLDLMLPRRSGLDVCRDLRSEGMDLPVLFISARDSVADKVAGLDSGADDYVAKPFEMEELLARLRALLRRRPCDRQALTVDDLHLVPSTREALRAGRVIHLSATEYALLECLMRRAHQAVSRDVLLNEVWGYDFGGNCTVLDVYINYLRNKLDRERPLIHTVRRVGYRLGPA